MCKGRKVLSLVLLIARMVYINHKPSFFYFKRDAIMCFNFLTKTVFHLTDDGRPPKTHETTPS